MRAAPLVTKTLLFVTEGDQINVRTPPERRRQEDPRATTRRPGRWCGRSSCEAGSTGTLMTYLHQGKQYIVVAIGGLERPAEFVALSLP